MIFEINTSDRVSPRGNLRAVKVLYSDGFYDLMGYCEAQIGFFENDSELIAELKESLMHIFRILENAERRIFRKHKVDARGKLNYKNFNHR